MPKALVLIRDQPHYRRDAFAAGVRAAGFDVVPVLPNPAKGDLLVIWNRYGHNHATAQMFERVGGSVLVAENGYIGRDADGQKLYSLQRSMLHGYGSYPDGDTERWERLGIELQPWRRDGLRVVVLAQRGIGIVPVASTPADSNAVASAIRAQTGREVMIRKHPGDKAPAVPLDVDLIDALCAVTHTSAAGLHAMVMGVPVITTAEKWIGLPGATYIARNDDWRNLQTKVKRNDEDRLKTFQRLAWAQWTLSEIGNGVPFRFMCT